MLDTVKRYWYVPVALAAVLLLALAFGPKIAAALAALLAGLGLLTRGRPEAREAEARVLDAQRARTLEAADKLARQRASYQARLDALAEASRAAEENTQDATAEEIANRLNDLHRKN